MYTGRGLGGGGGDLVPKIFGSGVISFPCGAQNLILSSACPKVHPGRFSALGYLDPWGGGGVMSSPKTPFRVHVCPVPPGVHLWRNR